jgi:hypothetical protein
MNPLGVNRVVKAPAPGRLAQRSPRMSPPLPLRISEINIVLLNPSVTEANEMEAGMNGKGIGRVVFGDGRPALAGAEKLVVKSPWSHWVLPQLAA